MIQKKNCEIIPILLVEDDEDDIAITKKAFKKAKISNPLHVVRDGEEALEFLTHTGRYTETERAPKPGLILLDLNMPRLSGREVLDHIKKDSTLQRIPVVVLTTSDEDADMLGCYDRGANTYITKPVDFNGFMHAVITIGTYWLSIATIPDGC